MQSLPLLNVFFPTIKSLSESHRLPFFPHNTFNKNGPFITTYQNKNSFKFLNKYKNITITVQTTGVEEIAETSEIEQEFVEIGYICGVHGLQGEVRVKPYTDFPELRFSQPGRRWLKQQILGKDRIQEVEIIEGRGHHGQKSWIVRFNKIDTVEEAQQLIGSAILVTDEDKPELEEGDFYSRDLVGMRVILKETGEKVGTVVNVFDSGGSDLLQVMLNPSVPESDETASGPLVYVPFAEAIVPIIDMNKREMLITPPNGLLELNIKSDERSKKERRALDWKERKKYQKRLIAAKKKLCEMEQQHIFHGFKYGDKAQTSLLADQILSVNTRLLHQALPSIKLPSQRWNLQEFIDTSLIKSPSRLKISKGQSSGSGKEDEVTKISNLKEKGRFLLSEGKVAIVLHVTNFEAKGDDASVDNESIDSRSMLDAIFNAPQSCLKQREDRTSVPLVMVCPANQMQSLQDTFASHNHFDLDSQKVWFLEEEKLPVLGASSSTEEQTKHHILMKSPWEILQTPVGSGGIISSLASNNFVENLAKIGVEYIEVCSTNLKNINGDTLIGLVSSCEANLGVQISKDMKYDDNKLNMVLSIDFMKHLTRFMKELHFHAIPKSHAFVEKVDKEWIDVIPNSPNSFELHCSIYSCLKVCPSDKICLMEVNG